MLLGWLDVANVVFSRVLTWLLVVPVLVLLVAPALVEDPVIEVATELAAVAGVAPKEVELETPALSEMVEVAVVSVD